MLDEGGKTYPCVDLALPASHFLSYVVLKHAGKSRFIGDRANPARELRVPAQGVSTDKLSVGLGEVD
jgi:hypothetical protein